MFKSPSAIQKLMKCFLIHQSRDLCNACDEQRYQQVVCVWKMFSVSCVQNAHVQHWMIIKHMNVAIVVCNAITFTKVIDSDS